MFEIVVSANKTDKFALTAEQADEIFKASVAEWKETWKRVWNVADDKLPWREEKMILTPKKALIDLVRRSRELGGGEG